MAAAWGAVTAREILSSIDGALLLGPPDRIFHGLSTDSRKIRRGDLFLALKGERYDGHDFLKKAVENGAAGMVVQKNRPAPNFSKEVVVIGAADTLEALGDLAIWWRREHPVQVVAITGSSGKTTTKEMVFHILETEERTLKNEGNLNNLVGLPLSLLRLEEGHEKAVLEMGMNRPGEIRRLTKIAGPHVGVITNVGMAHLEGVGDLKGVVEAKLEMLEALSEKARVVLNGDDSFLMEGVSRFKREAMTFGLGEGNQVRASGIRDLGWEGMCFRLEAPTGSWEARLRVPGLHNVQNALAAAAAALCLNKGPEPILQGLAGFTGMKGRFEIVSLQRDMVLVDDTYNANPSSLKAALAAVKASARGPVLVALGEMMELGPESAEAHQEAGRMAAGHGADLLLALGEHAPDTVRGGLSSGMSADRARVVGSHEDMVESIREQVTAGAVILVKGSRKAGLERVVEALRGDLGDQGGWS